MTFLSDLGEVFCVFDQNDSGNLSLGLKNKAGKKFFVKIAGLQTCYMCNDKNTTIQTLKKAVSLYQDLADEALISLVDYFSYKNLFVVVFDWFEGGCLFDHWNFDYYAQNPHIVSPYQQFHRLTPKQKIDFANQVFHFLEKVEQKNYIAIDFYESSILYQFQTNCFKICDIDLFQKMPVQNNLGHDFWGSKRLKSPEEYTLGAPIDSRTNVFKVGAFFFHLFGYFTPEQIAQIYQSNQFVPIDFKHFTLSYDFYKLLTKAVNLNPENRYPSIAAFKKEWLLVQNTR